MSSSQRSIDGGEVVVACGKVHARHSEYLSKPLSRHRHRTSGGSAAGSGLRKCRGHRGMEGDVAFDLLHHLVNVPVQDRDGAEALKNREGLRAVLGGPAPLGVNRPKRDVREDDDRRAGAEVRDILSQPFQLVRADCTEPVQLDAVVEADEMHALVIETLPALPRALFAEAFEEELAVVPGHVVLARHVEDFFLPKTFEDLVKRIEFGGLGKVGEIARMQDQFRLVVGGVDPVNSHLQSGIDVGIRRPVEADMAVADLDELKIALGGLHIRRQQLRGRHSPRNRPNYSGARPRHALKKAAAIDVVVKIFHGFAPLLRRLLEWVKYSPALELSFCWFSAIGWFHCLAPRRSNMNILLGT